MRVLIATATAGGGHVAAAAALAEAWRSENPADTIETVDLLQFFSKLHAGAYSRGYVKFVETAPELWGAVFKKTDDPRLTERLRRWRRLVPGQSQRGFLKHVRAFKPNVLLCTHYQPLEALRLYGNTEGEGGATASFRALRRTDHETPEAPKRPLVVSVITDFEAHALWMAEGVDLYCVAAEHTRSRLLARGAGPGQVLATGIPISAKFSRPLNAPAIRRAMGLRDDLPVLLVLSGGFGMGPISQVVAEIDKAAVECQIVVVTGRNRELRCDLAAQDRKHPTHVLGYASNMHELMGVADLVVSKPGGLTTSEALASGKPLIIMNPIPGQEAANSDFLLENGAACKVNRPEDLPFRLKELLSDGKLEKLSRAARNLGRPDAALSICKEARRRGEALLHGANCGSVASK